MDIETFTRRTRLSPAGCIEWAGHIKSSRTPYGVVCENNRRRYAHRVSWELANGPIPPGMCVLHRCDNPRCVNPEHLFLGTQAENMRDMKAKGRGRAPAGTAHRSAKLTAAQVRRIRRTKISTTALAEEYGVSYMAVYSIRKGLTWRAKGAQGGA